MNSPCVILRTCYAAAAISNFGAMTGRVFVVEEVWEEKPLIKR